MYSILSVDDEPIIRKGIKTFTDFEKYKINNIYEAEDGNSAFKIFSELLPDLVLLDINIPFTDGLTLARDMKSLKKDVKIVIISGYDYFDYAQKALKIGVEDYILKPVSKSDINEIITKLVYKLDEEKKHVEAKKIMAKLDINNFDSTISHDKYKDTINAWLKGDRDDQYILDSYMSYLENSLGIMNMVLIIDYLKKLSVI